MDEAEEVLALQSRSIVYKAIEKSPGLHFREIQRRSGLAVGSLQYHLSFLEQKHLIRTERDGKFLRYYSIRGKQLGEDTQAMSLLRQESLRKIILFLMQKRSATNEKISAAVQLSPSTVSEHLSKLVFSGVVGSRRRGRRKYFFVSEKQRIAELLKGYRKSFLDEMVNNFVEVWEKI